MSPRIDRNEFQAAGRDNNLGRTLQMKTSNDDFFTDSVLDSSRIPTPSPSKNHAKSASASRPRRALGTTRTLRAAWDATASSAPPSSAGDNPRSLQDSFKPASVHRRGRSPAKPAKSQTISSPPRARQTSLAIASPNSDASSPPRGLNDVYQRIADEERLAAQEGEIGEDQSTNSTMSPDSQIDDDRQRLNRIRSSRSPLTFRSPNHNSLQPQTTETDQENQSDNTGLTTASGMSFLENMTDQVLAAKLTPHTRDRARDRARLDKAIQKSTPVAFSKAQVGLRHALTSENLQRSGRRGSAGSVPSSSNGTLPNEETATPPPNVPRAWGSKGRVEKDWLRKIHDRNASPADITSGKTKQETSPMNGTTAAAEVPLPSVEDSLTPRPANSRESTPAPISKQASQDWVRQWMLNDFTANNLQVSDSPPVKVRGNVPDHTRDREIETLEKRAVTTSRLGEIRKKNSHSLLASRSRSTDREAQQPEDDASSQKKEAVTRMEEGEPIPNTPIVVFKAPANGVENKENAKSRPLHDRKDSRDSLQRLARAISESPRPSLTPEDWSLIREEEIESAKAVVHQPGNPEDSLRKSFTEVSDDNPTPSIKRSRSADAARTPVVTGAWTDTLLPDTIKTVKQRQPPPKYDQTPHVSGGWVDTPAPNGPRQSPAIAPVLMEKPREQATTDPVKQDARSEETDNKSATTKRPPNLPRALSNLLTKAKRKIGTAEQQHGPTTEEEEEEEDANNDTLNLGDATIESLEELLTLDNADMTTLLRMGQEVEAREKADADREAGIGTEAELLERLGTKLERLKTNIHDARKGISKLEHQVSQSPQHTDAGASAIKSNNGAILATSCQACGCAHGSFALPGCSVSSSSSSPNSDLYLTIPITQIPIPRLWHRHRADPRDEKHRWWWRRLLPRPTPLGWFTLAVWMWYISETMLCAQYCHPEFAEYYTWPDRGQGDRRRERYGGYVEPRWGWVLWTLLRRGWNRGPGGLVRLLLRLAIRWLAILAGWTTGFATGPTANPSAAAGGGVGGVGGPNGNVGGVGVGVGVADADDLSLDATTMIHDEYL